MPMKNPSHPGRLVKADIDELGLTIAEAAKGLGVTRQQLYRVINGECAITPEMADSLSLGCTTSVVLEANVAALQQHVREAPGGCAYV